MNDLRKAAEMALEALCSANPIGHALEDYEYHNKATEALRQALAQPEQEPVAWLVSDAQGRYATIRDPAPYGEEVYEPLYAAPPSKQWVGLTDEERVKCYETTGHYQTLRPQDSFAVLSLARAIEAKLKEKNT